MQAITPNADPHRSKHCTYHIRLNTHLDAAWSEWFDGMTIANQTDGTCILAGLVADQAALHGLLNKVRDLGLTLIEVKSVADKP